MSKVYDRYLEIVGSTALAATTIVATKVNYYRSKAELDAANPFTLTATFPAAAVSPYDITMGELVPPPTIIRLTLTMAA